MQLKVLVEQERFYRIDKLNAYGIAKQDDEMMMRRERYRIVSRR